MTQMTLDQWKMARHALGLPNSQMRSYRNRYATTVGSKQEAAWSALVDAGKAERGHDRNVLAFFHLTLEGAREALEPAETLDREDFPAAQATAS